MEFVLTTNKIQRYVALGHPLGHRYLQDVISGRAKGIPRKRKAMFVAMAKKQKKKLEARKIMPPEEPTPNEPLLEEPFPPKPSLDAMLDFFQSELKAGHLQIIPPAEAALRLQKDRAELRESIKSTSHLLLKELAADNGPSMGS